MGAMKVWDGTTWQTVAPFSERASCFVGPDQPTGPTYAGDLWWDTDDPTIAYPGAELAYAQITAAVTISATSGATAQAVVTAPATTFDGSPVVIECCAPYLQTGSTAGSWLQLNLFDGSTELGILGFIGFATTNSLGTPFYTRKRLTPTAGSHTYSFRAFIAGSNGTVGAGTGAAGGAYQPAFIRVTRV